MPDSQVMVISDLMTRILIGDTYKPTELEECLEWLQNPGDQAISCPFDRWALTQLANEVMRAIQRSQPT